ncbi:HdeD family acid-resistance protein [Variovorax soli]|uniref:HdeD family acid-resistance protein n=1 Tax=Variovorax soli TaxID=376815 RepID=UPI000838468C|nr:HdeD family acid-resistance protein [Variovorax soli]
MLLQTIQRSWWVLAIYGVISILFGIGAVVWPLTTALALAWAFGVMALAEGVTSAIALFDKNSPIPKGWLALYALASIAFGIVAVIFPGAVAGVLLLFLAAWLVVGGIYRIVFAVRVRKQIEGEWWIGLSGLLSIVLGVLFFAYPAAGLVSVTVWIGAFVLLYGVFQLMAALRVRKLGAALPPR